jgi:hydroxymethylpyrimidine/phosphomethylpyrimidine kinase
MKSRCEKSPPAVLTIGGSDSSGQAGIQADLRTFAAHDVNGLTAITAVTIQNHERIVGIQPVGPEVVEAQVREALQSFPIRAIKTGMLVSEEHVESLCRALDGYGACPLVVDPVLVSSSGTRLLSEAGLAALTSLLLPRAAVITPNLPEAAAISGVELSAGKELMAVELAKLVGEGTTIVIKGGHDPGSARAEDLVRLPNGVVFRLDTEWVHAPTYRGTGCTFSAAIAANLARGEGIDTAVREAKKYITGALRHARALREGAGPIDHFWDLHPREKAAEGGDRGE